MGNMHQRRTWNYFSKILLCLLLTACKNPNLSQKDTITTIVASPVQTLNPLFSTDAGAQHINELTHAPLVRTSMQLVPEPYLAKSFRFINDKTIEFELRENCRFPSGAAITTSDVEKSLNFLIDPLNKSPFADTFKKIIKFEKINDYKFRIHLEKPSPSLLSDMSLLKILPVDQFKAGENIQNLAGAGPYQVASYTNESILLERSAQTCLPIPPSPKIKIKVVREDLSRFLKLKNGELDIVLNEMNFRKVEAIEKDPTLPLEVKSAEGTSYNYLGVNISKEKLKDLRVREAIALSLDIPKLIKYKSRGKATMARNLLSDKNYFANLNIPFRNRDLEKARKLLGESGYFDGKNNKPPLRVELKTNTNTISMENARVLAAQAKEAGIIIELRPYEWGIFYNDVKTGNTELFLLRWVGITDPSLYKEIFHSSEIGKNNRTFYKNAEMDELLTKSESTLDPVKRKKIFQRVQEIAYHDLPYINLWHIMNVAVHRKELKDVELHPTGSWIPFLKMRKE